MLGAHNEADTEISLVPALSTQQSRLDYVDGGRVLLPCAGDEQHPCLCSKFYGSSIHADNDHGPRALSLARAYLTAAHILAVMYVKVHEE